MYNAKDPEERRKVEECVYKMVDRALAMDGTCTGEHGIGLGKKQSLVKELGLDTIGVMQKLKMSIDPLWIMNPGTSWRAAWKFVLTKPQARYSTDLNDLTSLDFSGSLELTISGVG